MFWKEGILLLCKRLCVCVGLEKRQIKGTTFEWKDSYLQDTKALRKSSTIIYFRVCRVAGGWTQSKARLEATTWSPPAVKLQSSGALESRSELDFPLHNLQWAPSVFFFCFQKLPQQSVLSLFTPYTVGK